MPGLGQVGILGRRTAIPIPGLRQITHMAGNIARQHADTSRGGQRFDMLQQLRQPVLIPDGFQRQRIRVELGRIGAPGDTGKTKEIERIMRMSPV